MSDIALLETIDIEQALRALVLMRAADRAEREPEPEFPTEILLNKAGLTHAQIGAIIESKPATVAKRIQRAEAAEARRKTKGAKA